MMGNTEKTIVKLFFSPISGAMQIYLLGSFFCLMIGYHILHTFFGFGIELVAPAVLSIVKDVLWILLVGGLILTYKKALSVFLQERKPIVFMLFGLLIWSLGLSFFQGMSRGSIAIGLKYDIYPLIVLVSAVAVGYMLAPKISLLTITRNQATLFLGVLLAAGVLWQSMKWLFPEFFLRFGYGPVGDYALGSSPPIWYRTGPGGMMRLQGIFSGPNNYGFFLVGIAGLITFLTLNKGTRRKKLLLGLLFASSLFLTFSRGAWIGAGITVALTIWWYFPRYTKYMVWGAVRGIVGIVRISAFKTGSTSGHLTAFWEGIYAFLAQPWGYGLGMAGPSIHYEGVYLPENQYMQILLDLGLPGLVLRGGVLFGVLQKAWKKVRHHTHEINIPVALLLFGILGLCVEGMFLHVWEDSMVNYLLLGSFGLLLGYLHATKNYTDSQGSHVVV